jgi:dienelactone hydrolase
MRTRFLLGCLISTGVVSFAACSDDTPSTTPVTVADAGPDTIAAGGAFDLEVPCTDSLESIYADPGTLPAYDQSQRGKIIKCAIAGVLTKAELEGTAKTDGYAGKAFTSGARVYKVLYRTERGTEPAIGGTSSAVVFVPDTPRAAKLPVIVASHGTAGQGKPCTPTNKDPVDTNIRIQAYPLAGAGFTVIAPDLAGYANYGAAGNPVSGYAGASDVGKSTLDGARALRTLLSKSLTEKVVLVGHSQGGHTTFSAQAMHDSYGSGGTLVGVVGYAPLWLSQRTWGALFVLANQYTIKDSGFINAVDVWYHYTNGELVDPGHGLDIFREDKKAGIKSFIDNACLKSSYPELEALGTTAKDLYTQDFQDAISLSAAAGATCDDPASSPVKGPLCQKWMARYAADRPHLEGAAAKVPMLVLYGGADTTIPKDRMSCVFDRLKTDAVNFKVCYDPPSTHSGLVTAKSEYVNDWIANVALGEAAPAACALDENAVTGDGGALVKCATPPPND